MENKITDLIENMGVLVEKFVKHYKNDFYTHDIAEIKKSNYSFIWCIREHGTRITPLYSNDDIPQGDDRVNYLFGTADKKGILEGTLETISFDIKEGDRPFFYVDRQKNTLEKITGGKALDMMKRHNEKLLLK